MQDLSCCHNILATHQSNKPTTTTATSATTTLKTISQKLLHLLVNAQLEFRLPAATTTTFKKNNNSNNIGLVS
jgi:hypothetical protein